MVNGMIIDALDNVGVAIEQIKKGDQITYVDLQKNPITLTAAEDIQIYHKFALKDIAKDTPVVKYGQHIGAAATDIKAGEHVHVHNVKNVRENLK